MENEISLEKEAGALNKPVSPVNENKLRNETVTTELHFELLKQYAWLSSATIGAIVILIQLKLISFDTSLLIPLACFGFSIMNSLFAQDYIVESLAEGKSIYDISNQVKIFRRLTVMALGLGTGLLMSYLYQIQSLG